MSEPRRIDWAARALLDLHAIFDYHRQRNQQAARRLVARIADAAARIGDNPEAGAVAADLEPADRYRSVVVRPYRIIYRVDADRIYVLRVWDSRRDPNDLRAGD